MKRVALLHALLITHLHHGRARLKNQFLLYKEAIIVYQAVLCGKTRGNQEQSQLDKLGQPKIKAEPRDCLVCRLGRTSVIWGEQPESPSEKSQLAASGNTVTGPRRLGAVARAIITQTDPMICEKARVALT